ncbi:hypothetical protein WJX72_011553 [[Myrmecia] bisecta]|uniref:NAD-dependent epimerase/dehydratase domain-containing protein n=1 Tax=[Myrmecia] bisecta TaxID=41462 RepID=A0AAW1QT07_9CHLO
MKVFLTNATGYVGGAIARRLIHKGHRVVALLRTPQKADAMRALGIESLLGTLDETDKLAQAAATADAVIHTAYDYSGKTFADNVAKDRAVIAAFVGALAGTNKPLLVTSGSGMLGDTGSEPVSEEFPTDPLQPQDLLVRSLSERDTLRAAQRGVRSVLLRLPLYVYGNGGSTFIPAQLADAKQRGAAYRIGAGDNKLSAVHVEDLAELAMEKAPAGSLFNAANEHGITGRSIVDAVAQNLGVPARQVTAEEADAQEILPAWFRHWVFGNNQIDSKKAERLLGWTPAQRPGMVQDIASGSYKQ